MNAPGRRTILGTAIVLVVILMICAILRHAATTPELSVGIGSYLRYSNHLEVVVNLTNAGSVPIVYLVTDTRESPRLGWLATEGADGWAKLDLPPHGLRNWTLPLLQGESAEFRFDLRSDTLRWKFGFSFRRLTPDDRAAELPWLGRLCPSLAHALDRRAERKKFDLQFESGVFEVQNNEKGVKP